VAGHWCGHGDSVRGLAVRHRAGSGGHPRGRGPRQQRAAVHGDAGNDPTATWAVNDPLRIYYRDDTSKWVEYKITAVSSQTGYFDYTVTYTGYSGEYATPPDGTPLLLSERTTTAPGTDDPVQDPLDGTIDEVKAYVNGLPDDDNRDNVIQALLDRERQGRNRATLVSWLDQQTGVE